MSQTGVHEATDAGEERRALIWFIERNTRVSRYIHAPRSSVEIHSDNSVPVNNFAALYLKLRNRQHAVISIQLAENRISSPSIRSFEETFFCQ